MKSLLVSACVDRFLLWTAANRKPKTVEHYRYQLGRFVKLHGRRRLSSITPALVSSFSRAFHPVQAVQRLCSWCHRCERSVKENPLHGMPKARMGQRRRVLDRAEMVRLLRATWADGAGRRGVQLPPGQCMTSPAYFSLPTGKHFEFRTQAPDERVIPISPRLGRLLDRLARKGVTLDAPILRDSRGRPWTANAFRCRMRRLRVVAGVGPDRRGERAVLYSFRHTGATAAAVAGVGQYVLAGVLGHASPRTTERYVHPRPADLVDVMKTVWESKSGIWPKIDRTGSSRNCADDPR